MSIAERLLLAHEQLFCIGGPRHGETLPITRGGNVYMVTTPTVVDVTSFSDPYDVYAPGPSHVVRYDRCRIVVNDTAHCDVLVADGHRLTGRSTLDTLTDLLAVGVALALGHGVVWREQFADRLEQRRGWLAHALEGDLAAAEYPQRWVQAAPMQYGSPDTWSRAARADVCWRCDAVPGTSDVGLCGDCLADLRDDRLVDVDAA